MPSTIHQDLVAVSAESSVFTNIAPLDINLNSTALSGSTIDLVNFPEIRTESDANPEIDLTSSPAVITIDSGSNSVDSTNTPKRNSTRNSTRSVTNFNPNFRIPKINEEQCSHGTRSANNSVGYFHRWPPRTLARKGKLDYHNGVSNYF